MIAAKKLLLAGRRAPFSIQSGFDANFDGWEPGQNHIWISNNGRTSPGSIRTVDNDGSRTRRVLGAALVSRKRITFSIYARYTGPGAGPTAFIAYRPDDGSAWIELTSVRTNNGLNFLSATIEQRNFQALQFGFRSSGTSFLFFDDASITGVPL